MSGEVGFTMPTYNMRRAINTLGTRRLMDAIAYMMQGGIVCLDSARRTRFSHSLSVKEIQHGRQGKPTFRFTCVGTL